MASNQISIARPNMKSSGAVEVIDLTSDNENENDKLDVFASSCVKPTRNEEVSESAGDADGVHAGNTDDEDAEEDEEQQAWESESLYEDALEEMGDDHLPADPSDDACTLEEAIKYRKQLRLLGEDEFLKVTLEAGKITAKRLCTAFGIRPPAFLEGAPDDAYYPLLGLAVARELSKRAKLPQYNTIDDAVELLKECKNIVVLTGAGISTSLGIPDFRSKDTGLYSKLEYLGLSDPQEVFDIGLFREDPSAEDESIFYSVAKDILPGSERFSPTHAFIKLLQDKDKLLTNYSQNIDDIESKAGISPERLIQCHGSFATATCLMCKYKVDCQAIYDDLKAGKVAYCPHCREESKHPKNGGMKRKRSSNSTQQSRNAKRRRYKEDDSSDDDDDDDGRADAKTGPDITFFGEALPNAFHDRLVKHDRDLVDLVIVIGTSLKVAPVSEIVGFLPSNVPQLYISRTPVAHVDFDVDLLGDCDVVVAELCRRAGWNLKHEMIPPDQRIDVHLEEGYASRYVFRSRGSSREL
ncbi:MAG: NAD-dependent histone deacetylase sir2 [Peltula sp. TS41687]|nr:MAG: NAD-dependent histone deacetylase sir2 [Peltula sp. TS41687]